jgi:hypothetical protein
MYLATAQHAVALMFSFYDVNSSIKKGTSVGNWLSKTSLF